MWPAAAAPVRLGRCGIILRVGPGSAGDGNGDIIRVDFIGDSRGDCTCFTVIASGRVSSPCESSFQLVDGEVYGFGAGVVAAVLGRCWSPLRFRHWCYRYTNK